MKTVKLIILSSIGMFFIGCSAPYYNVTPMKDTEIRNLQAKVYGGSKQTIYNKIIDAFNDISYKVVDSDFKTGILHFKYEQTSDIDSFGLRKVSRNDDVFILIKQVSDQKVSVRHTSFYANCSYTKYHFTTKRGQKFQREQCYRNNKAYRNIIDKALN